MQRLLEPHRLELTVLGNFFTSRWKLSPPLLHIWWRIDEKVFDVSQEKTQSARVSHSNWIATYGELDPQIRNYQTAREMTRPAEFRFPFLFSCLSIYDFNWHVFQIFRLSLARHEERSWESKRRECSSGRAFPCSLQPCINFLRIVSELNVPRVLRASKAITI